LINHSARALISAPARMFSVIISKKSFDTRYKYSLTFADCSGNTQKEKNREKGLILCSFSKNEGASKGRIVFNGSLNWTQDT
jgi:hypothetical protein